MSRFVPLVKAALAKVSLAKVSLASNRTGISNKIPLRHYRPRRFTATRGLLFKSFDNVPAVFAGCGIKGTHSIFIDL